MLVVISFISLTSLLISCKDDVAVEKIKNNDYAKNRIFKNSSVEFEFEFPDTVYINEEYKGKILYKSVLDTITTSFEDKTKSRYIAFYMRKTKNINYSDEELKQAKLDTFGAINNRNIPFYKISFNQLGVHYIDGIINDHIFIDTISPNKNGNNKIRYIENIVRATHKVIVVRKP